MMKIIKKGNNNENYSLQTRELDPRDVGLLKNEIVEKILNSIKEEEKYPKQIAKEIKVHEQNVYYYIKKLHRSRIISLIKSQDINGTTAQFYKLSSPSFFISYDEFKKGSIEKEKISSYFDNFIVDGRLNAIIVVGSPEPHGPSNAVAKDGHYGMSFCLFLGSYLSSLENLTVKLDTQVSEQELKENNIISIGGTIVNSVSDKLNKHSPIQYKESKVFHSNVSGKIYDQNNIGVVSKFKNPYNEHKEVILILGIGKKGTKTAVLSFLHHFDQLEKGNSEKQGVFSNVFVGFDYHSTGHITKIDLLE